MKKETRQRLQPFRVRDQHTGLFMSMYRILGQQIINGKKVGGVLCSGHIREDAWDVTIFESNGHREVSARQVVEWREIGDEEQHVDALGNPVPDLPVSEKDLEERRQRSLEKAARRATTACRRFIKHCCFDELLTITYRQNQTNRALCKRHFKEWVRRMKRALPDFKYCASFERQDRGAMHIHLATHKLPQIAQFRGVKIKAWQLGTKIWRDIVGADNGLCFVGGRSRYGGAAKMGLAKMASYVSKYIMKDYAESELGANRYSRSDGVALPKPQKIRLEGCNLADLIAAVFECRDGDAIVSHSVGRWGDSYWLCTEPDPYYR